MLHWSQVWKQMRFLSNKEVEKGAVWELIVFNESLTDKVIHQSILEHDLLNANREKQGLPKKERIDRECVRRAIKSLSQKGFTSLSETTGGTLSEKGEEHDKRKPETEDLGAEII